MNCDIIIMQISIINDLMTYLILVSSCFMKMASLFMILIIFCSVYLDNNCVDYRFEDDDDELIVDSFTELIMFKKTFENCRWPSIRLITHITCSINYIKLDLDYMKFIYPNLELINWQCFWSCRFPQSKEIQVVGRCIQGNYYYNYYYYFRFK